MIKKCFSLALCCLFGLGMLCGCGGSDGDSGDSAGGEQNPPIQEEEVVSLGTFYSLEAAYENGWINKEELLSIAYYHNGGIGSNAGLMGENYTPLPKTPETLGSETDLAIRQTCQNELLPETAIEKISFNYYGTYNNLIVLRLGCDMIQYVAWNTEIDGVKFSFPDSIFGWGDDYIRIWTNNTGDKSET